MTSPAQHRPRNAARLLAAGAGLLACAATAATPPGLLDLAAMPLEGLLDLRVTGASRQPQRMSQAAASVSVISGDELRALGYRSIADALRSLRGLMVVDDRSYSYLGVRGFYAPGDYNTRVLLLVDGNRVNDVVYDQAMIGSEAPLDIEQVERIEFIPGQGAAVYGANALFGVVNVVTRRPAASGGSALLRLGSGRDREVQAGWSHRGDGVDGVLAASRRVRAGVDPLLPGAEALGFAGGVVPGIDHEQVNRLRLALQGRHWRTQLLHADRLKGIGAPVDVVIGDRRNAGRDRQTLLDASWQQPWGDQGEWQARLFGGSYRFVGDYVVDYPPVLVNRDDDQGRWWGAELRASTRAVAGHVLQLGLELQRTTRLTMHNTDLGVDVDPTLDLHARNRRLGVYAEDQADLGSGWTAVLGLRHDRVEGFAGEWSPRLALLWRAGDAWVFKALHGGAFRPPNTFERDYEVAGPGGYRRNPGLRPERVQGQELVAEWTPRPELRLTMAAYRTQARDLIVLQPVPEAEFSTYGFHNTGRMQLRGLEAEAQWRGSGDWRARINVSLQRPRHDGQNLFGAQSPRRMAKATLVLPLPAAWTLGLDGQALSRRGAAGGHALLNVHLSRSFGNGGWRLGLLLHNLFDRHHADPGSAPEVQPLVPQDGRRWSVLLGVPL